MTSQASRPNVTRSESPTDPFSSPKTPTEPVELIDMTQDDVLIESWGPQKSQAQACILKNDSREKLLEYVVSSLEAKVSGKTPGKYLTEDKLKLYFLMLQPVQDLLRQQNTRITQLEGEIERLQASKTQVSKSKPEKDAGEFEAWWEWNTKLVDCQFDRLVKLLGDSDGSEGIDKRRGNEQERETSSNGTEHLSDLQNLRDKIAKVTNEYEDGDDDDPYTPIRPGDREKNDEVATFGAKVLRLKNEYLESRNKASARSQGSVEGQ
ncbi:MAG: hypothetical protein M1839_003068 [Geoglossum umbratile]|nr:MAG: hypothetical protein M1839_003068 [Geoglossum umbratile]